jgi:hypothetical protein
MADDCCRGSRGISSPATRGNDPKQGGEEGRLRYAEGFSGYLGYAIGLSGQSPLVGRRRPTPASQPSQPTLPVADRDSTEDHLRDHLRDAMDGQQ